MSAGAAGSLPPCRILDWDTEYFGCRVGRVDATSLDPDPARHVRAWATGEKVACVYFLADAAGSASAHAAEAVGFRLMDVRVTLARDLGAAPPPAPAASGDAIGAAVPGDVSALREIARVSHRDSRFYADPRFSRDHCDGLYERWIAAACAGDADHVFVARAGDEAVGYLSAHLDPERTGRIGLVAVAERAQGRALGGALVMASLRWFADSGCERVTVVTQGRNASGLRLYERAGFTTLCVAPWFHLWVDSQGAAP